MCSILRLAVQWYPCGTWNSEDQGLQEPVSFQKMLIVVWARHRVVQDWLSMVVCRVRLALEDGQEGTAEGAVPSFYSFYSFVRWTIGGR